MRSKNYLLTYLFTLASGILLTALHSRTNIFSWIIFVIGILFIVPSIVSVFNTLHLTKKQKEAGVKRQWIMLIPAVGAFILGTLLCSMPDFFTNYLIYTLGVILIICGISQIFFITVGISLVKADYWFLSVPILTFTCGIVIIVTGPEKIASIVTILTGIVLICYSINGFIGYLRRESRLRQEQLLSHPGIMSTDKKTNRHESDSNESR